MVINLDILTKKKNISSIKEKSKQNSEIIILLFLKNIFSGYQTIDMLILVSFVIGRNSRQPLKRNYFIKQLCFNFQNEFKAKKLENDIY